jgi:quercetin dioxygenase-like cupin family protein
MTDPEHFQLHYSAMPPAPVKLEDGWRDMDIRFMVNRDNAGAAEICWWRTVFPPGGAHERHLHPNAAEVIYILSGRGAAGTAETEHEAIPGTAIYIPRGVVHWLRNADADHPLEIVGAYAPVGSLEEAGYEFIGQITEEYQQVK